MIEQLHHDTTSVIVERVRIAVNHEILTMSRSAASRCTEKYDRSFNVRQATGN
jgi:hypothetical protein